MLEEQKRIAQFADYIDLFLLFDLNRIDAAIVAFGQFQKKIRF